MLGVGGRLAAGAITAQIGRDDREALGEARRDVVPHHMILRVAVNEEQGRAVAALLESDLCTRGLDALHPLEALRANRFVLDGELVALDDDGRSNFGKLMFGRTGTHYFAFDLLMLDSTDLRSRPLESRKERLRELLQSSDDPVRYCDHVTGRGKGFFDLVRSSGLEGMVAKRRRSPYLGRLTDDWLKTKCLRTHDFVVGGWLHGETDGEPRALLLGEFFGDRPPLSRYGSDCGRVRSTHVA